MADYNLSGLSTRSFEQLIQTLAVEIIGPHVRVFGDGPDGQREATFEGRTKYPMEDAPWEGYGVVQAKFRQRPLGTEHDGPWALGELKGELEGFCSSKRRLRKPEFYVFSTNVVLSPKHETGGKDKAVALIESYRTKIGLKGYAIWDYDQLRTFLDQNQPIFRKYAAFITSGDVLAAMIQLLEGLHPDFDRVMTRYLQKELLADQYVRLEQAGYSTDQKTSIGNVFVDLPVFDDQRLSPPDEKSDSLPGGFLNYILDISRVKLSALPTPPTIPEGPAQPVPGRFVLMGGPGQGKTTLGQYLCQLHRAGILAKRDPLKLSPEARTALGELTMQCAEDHIEFHGARRFPVRVSLSGLADTLARSATTARKSLFSYILSHIGDKAELPLQEEDLRTWLAEYPWIVILDGLDEVPASANRDVVLKTIQEFWVDVAECGGDVFVVATTRPQGYNDDFSPRYYRHFYLAPLSVPRAIHYARRLARSHYGSNQDRQVRIVERLETACVEESTARLMRSPLQVTIMAALVDRLGHPPRDRWRLFSEYYRVIYSRERERQIPTVSQVLADHEPDINAIHRLVGLRLHVESEKVGVSEAAMTTGEFRALVESRLRKEGFAEPGVGELTETIIGASLNRLVFLVGVREDRMGFEIRSLQEYMAAESLMDGDGNQVRSRLEQIAPIPHWRNVFLFAAGRCFADLQHYRDMVVTICDQMDHADEGREAVRASARLALDILEDGMTRSQPKFAASFARTACRLLALPPDTDHGRLAGVVDDTIAPLVRQELQSRLRQVPFEHSLGAWSVLRSLCNRGIGWARVLAAEFWPSEPERRLSVFRLSDMERLPVADLPDLANAALHSSFEDSYDILHQLDHVRVESPELLSAELSLIVRIRDAVRGRSSFTQKSDPIFPDSSGRTVEGIGFVINLLMPPTETAADLSRGKDIHPSWLPFVSAARFAMSPGRDSLARELETLAGAAATQGFAQAAREAAESAPWPLAVCLDIARSPEALMQLSNRIRNGEIGDLGDWQMAEQRWIEEGFSEADVWGETECEKLSGSAMNKAGFPIRSATMHLMGPVRDGRGLLAWYTDVASVQLRSVIADFIVLSVHSLWPQPTDVRAYKESFAGVARDPEFFVTLLRDATCRRRYLASDMLDYVPWKALDEPWVSALDQLGHDFSWGWLPKSQGLKPDWIADLVSAVNAHPDRPGLLKLLSTVVTWIPESASDVRELPDPEAVHGSLRIAVACIRLVQQRWDDAEGRRLIGILMDHWTGRASLLHILRNRHMAPERATRLLLYAMRSVSEDDWGFRSNLIALLREQLSARSSELNDVKVYAELGLTMI